MTVKHCLNTVKHSLLVEKDRGNTWGKSSKGQGAKHGEKIWRKKRTVFLANFFLEVSVFTVLTVIIQNPKQKIKYCLNLQYVHYVWGRASIVIKEKGNLVI